MSKFLDQTGLTRVWERMKTYVTTQTAALDFSLFKIVTALPTSNIDNTKIYLLASTDSGDNNVYTEYIYANGAWEILGQYKANVDLTPYALVADLEAETTAREEADTALQKAVSSNTLAIDFDETTGELLAVTGADDSTFSDGALNEETGELVLQFEYN